MISTSTSIPYNIFYLFIIHNSCTSFIKIILRNRK
nr:MAG TPA: hypothetical protein [Caudoviricetes sp.]DAM06156.1 MAG TPA: hypothetical protein [Bacteriophage sp.]DAS65770.1 MAG TPA: hypothetical protein [Caudoviricetes sp.]DAS65862.1 MAG TPA: hypothetical protein [Caudoviricetes sp.]